jgi:hypothetical protein
MDAPTNTYTISAVGVASVVTVFVVVVREV